MRPGHVIRMCVSQGHWNIISIVQSRMHTHTYAYVHMNVHNHASAVMCMYVKRLTSCTYVHSQYEYVRIHTCIYVRESRNILQQHSFWWIHTYIYIYIYIYIYTHTHTYMHACHINIYPQICVCLCVCRWMLSYIQRVCVCMNTLHHLLLLLPQWRRCRWCQRSCPYSYSPSCEGVCMSCIRGELISTEIHASQ